MFTRVLLTTVFLFVSACATVGNSIYVPPDDQSPENVRELIDAGIKEAIRLRYSVNYVNHSGTYANLNKSTKNGELRITLDYQAGNIQVIGNKPFDINIATDIRYIKYAIKVKGDLCVPNPNNQQTTHGDDHWKNMDIKCP